jgi:hypothetical protein
MTRHNSDGSLKLNYDPSDPAWANDDDGEKYEVSIIAHKIFATQGVGMLFIAKIDPGSIFLDTDLEVGDRIAQIDSMNFREYADSNCAKKVISSAKLEVEIIVEKGPRELSSKRVLALFRW